MGLILAYKKCKAGKIVQKNPRHEKGENNLNWIKPLKLKFIEKIHFLLCLWWKKTIQGQKMFFIRVHVFSMAYFPNWSGCLWQPYLGTFFPYHKKAIKD